MSASFRLAIATEGFRGGLGGNGPAINQTVYVDQAIRAAVSYPSIDVSVALFDVDIDVEYNTTSVQVEIPSVEIDVDIEGCY